MENGIWLRCPECGHWCYAEKKGILGRLVRSFVNGDKSSSDTFGELADEYIGMKGAGRTVGRALNAMNYPTHIFDALGGDKFRFYCQCGEEFGTDDETIDMSEEYDLFCDTMNVQKEYPSIMEQSDQQKQKFTRKTQSVLAKVKDAKGILDAEAVLHDILACCYYFFFKDTLNALVEINKSLELFDDPKSHALKGIFMGNVATPIENYEKMNELLYIKSCERESPLIDTSVVKNELETVQKKYGESFISIPANQRKFLVVAPEYHLIESEDQAYLPKSFKLLKYDNTISSGVVFKNGFPNNNAIYVCHPYKPNTYYLSNSYQIDLFENQLNEFRELLQCLGAKSITTENTISNSIKLEVDDILKGTLGGGYKPKGISGEVSGTHKENRLAMESMVHKMLIDDEFSCNPDMTPFIPEGLVWFNHMEEWQRLARMRLRGQNKYSISVSSQQTRIVNENEANQVNAEFKALVANGNLEISQETELKVSEDTSHEWKLVVDFFPLSDYKNNALLQTIKETTLLTATMQSGIKQKKNNFPLFLLLGGIAILAVIILFFLL